MDLAKTRNQNPNRRRESDGMKKLFSYIAKCLKCGCSIYMEDDFNEGDVRICEECRK